MTRRRCDRCGRYDRHLCKPRAKRVVDIFSDILVHTKGDWARSPFNLTPWQRDDIIVPLFGTAEWSEDHARWRRAYRHAWIELARKNGKSELLAGIALILLCADDEEGAEIYGAACDKDQAHKVYDVAVRMVELSPVLSERLRIYKQSRRIVDPKYGSYYQVIAADAAGNLGHNPSGVVFDEVLTQPSRDLWDALRTGWGTRRQPLFVAATTASNDPEGFSAAEHAYCERVAKDPALDPRRFVYLRNTPTDADPWDEDNWTFANPALTGEGRFLSIGDIRDEAREAQNDPLKENAFRQFRLNQYVQQATRWIPLHVWDSCAGITADQPADIDSRAIRQRCFGGLDLSTAFDMTALCWVFPDLTPMLALWRFWLPEDMVPTLDRLTGGRVSPWVRQGWIQVTEGSTIDYASLYAQVEEDRQRYRVMDITYDPWSATSTAQEMQHKSITMVGLPQTWALSQPMNELMRLLKERLITHAGNPVARWHADSVEVKQDARERIHYVKPRRGASGKRIDGIAALVMAVSGVMERGRAKKRTVASWG